MAENRASALLLAAFVALAPGLALADGTPGPTAAQEAAADALFQRATEKVAKKDYAAACPLFEQAYHIAGGGGTAQNLAICYEDLGKVASAYNAFAELRRVSIAANRLDRVKLAEERIAKLEPRLSRLRVRVPEARRAPDLLIAIDGDTYGEKALEAGVAVDVGTHLVKITFPGKKTLEIRRAIVAEGTTDVLDIPATDAAAEALPAATLPTRSEADREAARSATRTVGLVVGGAGLVTFVVGAAFGVLTITTNAAARRACRDNTEGLSLSNKGPNDEPSLAFDAAGNCYASTPERPSPYVADANRIRDEARGYGSVATVLVPIGLAGLVVGTYLVLTARPDEPAKNDRTPKQSSARGPAVRARLVPGIGSLFLSGEFH